MYAHHSSDIKEHVNGTTPTRVHAMISRTIGIWYAFLTATIYWEVTCIMLSLVTKKPCCSNKDPVSISCLQNFAPVTPFWFYEAHSALTNESKTVQNQSHPFRCRRLTPKTRAKLPNKRPPSKQYKDVQAVQTPWDAKPVIGEIFRHNW